MPPKPVQEAILIRPYGAADSAFLRSISQRLHPGRTASPRNPELLAAYFDGLAANLMGDPGAVAFVAELHGQPMGVVAVHPDVDYFTGHARAYVDTLVVAPDAEGRGVGRALLRRVEEWARELGHREVVLDVFAGNEGAVAFYRRCGYQPDHIRMAKPLV
jgi:GNAT superfamily N-acetyltransferase